MFSERLRESRQAKGLTQQKMADLLGVSMRTYQRYEKSGDTEPPLLNLLKLADILDVSIDYLLGRDEWLKSHGVSFD